MGERKFLKLKLILLLAFSLFSIQGYAKKTSSKEVVGIFYFNKFFGHVHSASLRFSSSLTTIGCGHPVKVLRSSKKINKNWKYVKVGSHRGYILKSFLSPRRGECFQAKYPKFFNSLNVDLSDLYYWGRLYDHFISGKSKVNRR